MAKINEIEGLEGFSEELLESVRGENPELFEGLDLDEPKESEKEPEERVAEGTVTPPKQEEEPIEEPSKESADGTAKKPESKTVPLEALHEERERRRQLQQKLEQMQEQMMQLSTLQLEQARKIGRVQPEKAIEKDPLDELIDAKLADRMKPIEEQTAAMRYFRDFEARIVSQEQAAKTAHEDYETITEPVVKLTNYWKEQAEKGDKESAAKLQHFLSQPNPPEMAYTLGCAYQYQQTRQKQAAPAGGVQPPAAVPQQKPVQKQMPRSDGISGGGVTSAPALDLENITTEGWLKLPLETRRKLLSGRLE